MEIHKPKPVRSWRELLTEVGVIVLSVCIALAAEQAVEWVHWRGEVAAARQALKEEMAFNNQFLARRIANAPCLERQIREADAIIAALEARHEPGKFTTFRRGDGNLLSDSEWQSERASQVLTHFPHTELAVMSSYYAILPDVKTWIGTEGESWRELSGLRNPLPGLTSSDLMHLRVSLEAAKQVLNLITLNAPGMLRRSKQLGIADATADTQLVQNFCTMDDERYLRYVRTRMN
jgi:hypothetical protein